MAKTLTALHFLQLQQHAPLVGELILGCKVGCTFSFQVVLALAEEVALPHPATDLFGLTVSRL